MSSQVEVCEHHAKDCLQAAERAEDPLAREMLLYEANFWFGQQALAREEFGHGRDDPHRPGRIGLRPRDPRHGRERGSARSQVQKLPAVGKFHGDSPPIPIIRSPRRQARAATAAP